MPDRTTTLASTVLAAVLTNSVLMSADCAAARAAGDCLRAPNHEMSAGGHWRYRLDRQSRRKCWYLADEARNSGRVLSAKPASSPGKDSLQAAESISPANADARAELPVLTYTEPFMDGPLKSSPEEPAPLGGSARLNSAPSADSEPVTTNAPDVPTDVAPQPLPTAANHEPAAALPADEAAMPTVRLTLSLVLMVAGLAAVTAAVAFKRPDPVSTRLKDGPFQTRDREEPSEEMTAEEMISLASARDIPLFLVDGRFARD